MNPKGTTRRDFLKDGLIAGEAAALALCLGGQALAAAQPLLISKHTDSAPYKIGILGCGNRSKAHISALNDVPQIEVAALCDVVPHKMDERAKLIKKDPRQPRKYSDMEKMLAQEDLDAVAVVLPN